MVLKLEKFINWLCNHGYVICEVVDKFHEDEYNPVDNTDKIIQEFLNSEDDVGDRSSLIRTQR